MANSELAFETWASFPKVDLYKSESPSWECNVEATSRIKQVAVRGEATRLRGRGTREAWRAVGKQGVRGKEREDKGTEWEVRGEDSSLREESPTSCQDSTWRLSDPATEVPEALFGENLQFFFEFLILDSHKSFQTLYHPYMYPYNKPLLSGIAWQSRTPMTEMTS